MTQQWVAFDLDGTLTRRETLLYFLWAQQGNLRALRLLLRSVPTLLGYGMGWRSNVQAKEAALRLSLAGRRVEEIVPAAEHFAQHGLPRLLRPEVLARLREHRAHGHSLVLVTATLELYARPWALREGFDAVLATRIETDAQARITGRLAGENCWGPEKARRLREDLGIERLAYAYGNSRGDREMLAMAEHSICVCRSNDFGRRLPPLIGT
ncbi:HAD-IB family hydrolase [Acidithiobacillus sp. AMEEHan]|uniref:HAD-IB family hydrolase n=1 Tax=Acidithiobacillus sp. AMEEHan TaxID=2994951 RepID=UPI0027E53BC5|nr:HAD-IB family hydrolase [Acidithiobacillus sp. AMEEHan]